MSVLDIVSVANSNGSIFVDEIGIEIGILGDYRLKTTYRPVFRRLDGLQIEPFAMDASVDVMLHGRPAEERELGPTARSTINTLSVGNLKNLGVDACLFVEASLDDLADDRCLLQIVEKAEVDPARIICSIAAASLLDRHDLVEHALTLRSAGFGIGISGFGVGPWDVACMQAVRPDIVRMDGGLFRQVALNAPAERLMAQLVAILHDQGTDVLIDVVDTQRELRAALDCGADLLSGDLLGGFELAGSDIDYARRSVAHFAPQTRPASQIPA